MSQKEQTQGRNPWKRAATNRAIIAPSLLAADFARLGQQIDQVLAAGVEVIHVDVMDGHFVPNLSMGPGVVKSIRKYTDAPLDVHLMVTDPAYYLERFAQAGADTITFHVEATDRPRKLIARLRELGLGAGMVVKPATPAESLANLVAELDMVLVMTVEPGYGGQEFMSDMLDKIARIRCMLRPEQRLQVDGGINPETGRLCRQAGADVFVAGTDIFGSGDIPASVARLREGVAP